MRTNTMRNALILGSGRSGTSMLAGAFAHAGWYVGADPYPARSSNPKGFFESKEINGVNELLLSEADPFGPLGAWQRWLSVPPPHVRCRPDARSIERIRKLVSHAPYCFKDPRFAFTLGVWAPFTRDALRVCVFRHPDAVARSIVKECGQEDYLRGVGMTHERALAMWLGMHRRILDELRGDGEWLFAHYEQVLRGPALERIERAVGAPLDRSFPQADLQRNRAEMELSGELRDVYLELCDLAGFEVAEGRRAARAAAPTPALSAPLHDEIETRMARVGDECEQALESFVATGAGLSAVEVQRLRAGKATDCEAQLVDALPSIGKWKALVRGARSDADARSAWRSLQRVAQLEAFARVYARWNAATWEELAQRTPWPLQSTAALKLLVWPDWRESELAQLFRVWTDSVPDGADACLCLRHDAREDGDLASAVATLERAYAAVCGDQRAVDVLVIGEELGDGDRARLGRSVDGVLTLHRDASKRESFARQLGFEEPLDAQSLAAFVRRRSAAGGA